MSPAAPTESHANAAAPVSVAAITVNYRSAALTAEALASLHEEAARHADSLSLCSVVVENDSGDEAALRETVAGLPSGFARLVVSTRNGGFGAGNNLGVRELNAAGMHPDYLLFLNPDASVLPGAVLELVRFMQAHPQVGMCGSRFQTPDGSPWPFAFRFPSVLSELDAGARSGLLSRLLRRHVVTLEMEGQHAERVDWVSGASMMIRADLFERLGGFDEGFFLYFEEVDLCRRVADAGFECWYVPESRVVHACGQSTGVTDPDAPPRRLPSYWFESRRRYFEKNHGVAYAALADGLFLAGNTLGNLKDALRRRPATPFMSRDLLRASPLWPGKLQR